MQNKFYTTEEFKEAQETWKRVKSKDAWEIMFFCILSCCETSAFKIAKSDMAKDEIKDYALLSAIRIMNRFIKRDYEIQYLATVCRNEVFARMYNKKEVYQRQIFHTDSVKLSKI